MRHTQLQKLSTVALATIFAIAFSVSSAFGGAVMLTGHDILLHSGQNGYDGVILDFLRAEGGETKAAYDIAVLGSAGTGFANFTGGISENLSGLGHGGAATLDGVLTGYGSVTFYDPTAATAAGAGAGGWAEILAKDAMIVLSHTTCGGCSMTTTDSTELNLQSADIATAFNAGMDIWGNSGATLGTFYDFLPAGATTSAASISTSTGFSATVAGLGIGISDAAPSMINGFPTHNNFSAFDTAFTVYETHSTEGNITIGIQSATISTGGIDPIPEPGTMLLFGSGLVGLAAWRRFKKQA